MSKGRAKIAMSQGLSVWVLEAPEGFGDADFHAHHAIQISGCLSGNLSLTSANASLTGAIMAVAADARHRFEAHGLLVFIFVEPESRVGRALTNTLFAETDLVALDPSAMTALEPLRSTFEHGLDSAALLSAGQALVERLAPQTESRMPDPRVQRIIDQAAANLDRPLSLTSASEGVYLSPSRLRHLFVEQTGLAFKTYVLWLRLVKALEAYSTGQSLTEAAHSAGFSDSAHFSRVFRRTFGLPATTLTRL